MKYAVPHERFRMATPALDPRVQFDAEYGIFWQSWPQFIEWQPICTCRVLWKTMLSNAPVA
jgi:hypothetical protein